MSALAVNQSTRTANRKDFARIVAQAARARLIASGAWETEEDAEREVRHRSRHGVADTA
jgi:hypothetical protein